MPDVALTQIRKDTRHRGEVLAALGQLVLGRVNPSPCRLRHWGQVAEGIQMPGDLVRCAGLIAEKRNSARVGSHTRRAPDSRSDSQAKEPPDSRGVQQVAGHPSGSSPRACFWACFAAT